MTDPLRVLFVCNFNVCRSAAADCHFRAVLGDNGIAGQFRVASAGIHAVAGRAMLSECAGLLGADVAATRAFRSQALTTASLRDSGVIITMTRRELSDVLRLSPRSMRHAVTLLELAWSAGHADASTAATPADRLAELVRATVGNRGLTAARHAFPRDIPDPVGQPPESMRRTAQVIITNLDRIVERLTRLDAVPATAGP